MIIAVGLAALCRALIICALMQRPVTQLDNLPCLSEAAAAQLQPPVLQTAGKQDSGEAAAGHSAAPASAGSSFVVLEAWTPVPTDDERPAEASAGLADSHSSQAVSKPAGQAGGVASAGFSKAHPAAPLSVQDDGKQQGSSSGQAAAGVHSVCLATACCPQAAPQAARSLCRRCRAQAC